MRKQWRSCSDAVFCGIWSESALFSCVPQKGRLRNCNVLNMFTIAIMTIVYACEKNRYLYMPHMHFSKIWSEIRILWHFVFSQLTTGKSILGNPGVTHSVPTAFIRGDECSGYGMGHARVTEVGKSNCCVSFFFCWVYGIVHAST